MWFDQIDVVRELAPSEERFVRHGTYTGRSVSIEGGLDVSALRAAFAALQREYPVVTCRIGVDERGCGYLLRPGVAVTGTTVQHGDPAEIRLPATPLDPAAQLAYLDVVHDDSGRARVTLFAHHSVADAGHCVALLGRLWEHYTDQVETGTTTVVPHELPRPLEWYTADRGVVRAAASSFEAVTRPLPPDTPAAPDGPAGSAALARPRRTVLDEAATARIVDLGRRRGVTVNGLVTAALLRAFAAERADVDGNTVENDGVAVDSVHVGCLYPVDLRARFEPRVAAAAGTNMAGLASFAADITSGTDTVELARRISAALRRDLAAGLVQQSVLHFPDYYGPTRIHSLTGHVAITNTGVVPAFRTPAALRLTDYEIVYLSAHPRPSAGPSAAVTFLVYTFAGRLTIGLLGGGPHAALLQAAVSRELTTLSEAPVDA